MPRQWYRKLFVDHPGYAHGDSAALFGSGRIRDKVKVWCEQCYRARAADLDSTALEQLWSDRRAGWIACRPDACLSHLQHCILQPQHIRDRAIKVHALGLGKRRIKDRSRREMRRAAANAPCDRTTTEDSQGLTVGEPEHAPEHAGFKCDTGSGSLVADSPHENFVTDVHDNDQQPPHGWTVLAHQEYASFQTVFPNDATMQFDLDDNLVYMTPNESGSFVTAPIYFPGQDDLHGDSNVPGALFPEDFNGFISSDSSPWDPEHWIFPQYDFGPPS